MGRCRYDVLEAGIQHDDICVRPNSYNTFAREYVKNLCCSCGCHSDKIFRAHEPSIHLHSCCSSVMTVESCSRHFAQTVKRPCRSGWSVLSSEHELTAASRYYLVLYTPISSGLYLTMLQSATTCTCLETCTCIRIYRGWPRPWRFYFQCSGKYTPSLATQHASVLRCRSLRLESSGSLPSPSPSACW